MEEQKSYNSKTLLYVFYLVLLFSMCISYSTRLVGSSSDFLPFYDETHSYFLPGVNYFKQGIYKVFEQETFQASFGQPPIHQLLINAVNKVSQNKALYLRLNYLMINICALLLITFLLVRQTKSALLGLVFLFFTIFNFELMLALNQIYPDITSGVLFVLFCFALEKDHFKTLIFLSFLLGLYRLTSILLIPILILACIYKWRSNYPKRAYLPWYGVASFFLSAWTIFYKTYHSIFKDTLAMAGPVKSSEMFFDQMFNNFNAFFTEYNIIALLLILVFIFFKQKKFKFNYYLLASVVFYISNCFYYLGLPRYFIPGFILFMFGLLIQVNKEVLNKVFVSLILIILPLKIAIFDAFHRPSYHSHYLNEKFANEFEKVITKFIRYSQDKGIKYTTTNSIYNYCKVLNHYNKELKCDHLHGRIRFKLKNGRSKFDSKNAIALILHSHEDNEQFFNSDKVTSSYEGIDQVQVKRFEGNKYNVLVYEWLE